MTPTQPPIPADRLCTPLGGLVFGLVLTLGAFWWPLVSALR